MFMQTILVTGATGYIGGRLVPRLLEKGYKVRCLARHPDHLKGRLWAAKTEIVPGDVYKNENLAAALAGVEVAYYLIHSMADAADFERHEEISARNFSAAAVSAGVKRVVYLGGLGREGVVLSKHLASRQRVGRLLAESGLSITEFRAAIIVGSGSISFEIIRYLVERLPFIPCFRYLKRTRCQPVAIRDVLSYLINCLDKPETAGRRIEIGGLGTYTYLELLEFFAVARGLKRWFPDISCMSAIIPSAALSADIIGLLTPIPKIFARPLLESLEYEVVCTNSDALALFPEIKPLDYQTAVKYALMRISENAVETTWAMSVIPEQTRPYAFIDREGLIAEERTLGVNVPASRVFETFCGIGGGRGWFYLNWLWTLRALMDRAAGGIGMRRGRRHPDIAAQGEPLDFWRVERVMEGRLILLRAEMKLPGKGWLEFEAVPRADGGSVLRQTAYFEPRGFMGNIYWYALYPIHKIIFAGLIAEIKKRSENNK
ncbi:MAG TPA: DUF2867 domain-containing protein [Elusimicrobia bacterium]|nr:DUF2867 domain-containing protein [Elusimicrobiota bacterium]HCE99065.1 DUF2867 domain-containing protein [Elusimicrobiota bacterium]